MPRPATLAIAVLLPVRAGAQIATAPALETAIPTAAHARIPAVQMLLSAQPVVQAVCAVLALALFATVTILLYNLVALPWARYRLRQSRALDRRAAGRVV